jgi:hypothetical protein
MCFLLKSNNFLWKGDLMDNNTISISPQCIRISDGKVFNLDTRMTTIGGSSKCRIIITGDQVPPHIAHIVFTGGVWTLSVISRKPSVLVNNKVLENTRGLLSGDIISIGTESFTFTDSNEVESSTIKNEKSPLRMFISAISRFARTSDSDVRFELLAAIARLLRADGARLVVENQPDIFVTIAHYPQHSGPDRYSRRAILWAKEKGATIRTHITDWADSKESKGSLELNSIGTVLYHPLFEGEKIRGYLYIDRCTREDLLKMIRHCLTMQVRFLVIYLQYMSSPEDNGRQLHHYRKVSNLTLSRLYTNVTS